MKRFILLVLLWVGSTAVSHAANFQFIVHPETNLAATVSQDDMKKILLGNKDRWENGAIIRLAILAGGPVHDAVIGGVTARTADQFDKYWKKQVFTGKGVMPVIVADDAAMLAYVVKTPGAFGYISSSTKSDQVKVISIE
jgi:ABC-type phosphate transport system substrate-binding protein